MTLVLLNCRLMAFGGFRVLGFRDRRASDNGGGGGGGFRA